MNTVDTNELVDRAVVGDTDALHELLGRHRGRLRKMISFRLDRGVNRRVDPSDVVQETLAEAARELEKYAQNKPVSFYPWLRNIAWQRLIKIHRRHIATQRRSVRREAELDPAISDDSLANLANCLVANGSTPSQDLIGKELQARVQLALDSMATNDRELLVMRYLEQLATREIAEILTVSEAVVRQRHARALVKLQKILVRSAEESSKNG